MLQIIKFNLALSLLYQIQLTCNLVSYCQKKGIQGSSLMTVTPNAHRGVHDNVVRHSGCVSFAQKDCSRRDKIHDQLKNANDNVRTFKDECHNLLGNN